MNILVLSWRDPKHPLAGGAEQVMHEHMKGWVSIGHSVTHFSSFFNGCKRDETIDEIRFIRNGSQLIGVQVAAFFWYLFANHPDFDLVVDEFHGIPFFTPLYIKTPKLAVIQEIAGKVWLKNELPMPFNWLIGIIGYLTEPFVFLFYRKIPFMTGSESAKRDLTKMGIKAGNITVINHGLKVTRPEPLPPKEKVKTVMYLGAITSDKGIDDVLKVFCLLNKEGKFNFWVAGRASPVYKKRLYEMAKKYDLKNFTYFGFVSERRKFELLRKAHVLVNPSLLEGWGLVNVEANAMETPVVAYNSPGLVDSVKNGVSGVIVSKNTPFEMSRAVLEILEPETYRKLSKGAMSWSEKFSWEDATRNSLTLIEEVVRFKK